MRPGAGTEFDRYRETYEAAVEDAIGFAGQEHAFYVEAKARRLLELARRRLGPEPPEALDVGCGVGLADGRLLPHVASLHGVDVSEGMVERARAANPAAAYEVYDGRTLPFAEASFDLVFAICVLHHVEPRDREALATELARVARPGGLHVTDAEYLLFFPWRGRAFAAAERALRRVPLGAQYAVAGRPRP